MRFLLVAIMLAGCTPCQQVGALGGAALAGLGVMTGAYVSDSLVNLPHKCGGIAGCGSEGTGGSQGEPLAQVFSHHVQTTDNVMLFGGLFAIPFGAIVGTEAAHLYCDGAGADTPWSWAWKNL